MVAKYQTQGFVMVEPNSMAELVTSTLDRLGYRNIRFAKIRAEFTAIDKDKELIYTDYWTYEYRLRLSWEPKSNGSKVTVRMQEKEGSGTDDDCKNRAIEIIDSLKKDANQAELVKSWYQPSQIHGSAKWAQEDDLIEKKLITPYVNSNRLLLAPYDKNLYLQLPELSTYKHAIVCGRTGVGKSTGFFIPNLIERDDISMIVTEATPGEKNNSELYNLTAGYRKNAGQSIYQFNPTDLTSHRINPIDVIRIASTEQKSDAAEKLAALLITNASKENARVDPTWDQSEKLLLTSLILHTSAIEKESGHMGFIRWLMLSGVKEILKVMKNSPSELGKREFRGWLNNTSENFRFGVISGLLTKLNPWISDTVTTLTSTTDLDLNSLTDDKFTFYLSVPSNRESTKYVGSLVLNFLFEYLLSNDLNQPLAMMLDEFTNFGFIPGMAENLAIVRKQEIGMVLGFQNVMQVEKIYGRQNTEIIMDQASCQVYFRQKNIKEARLVSQSIGRTTLEERRTQHDGRIHEQIIGRDLITADELTNMPDDTVIILSADTNPIMTKKFIPGAYEQSCLVAPPVRQAHSISKTISERNELARQLEGRWYDNTSQNQPDRSTPVEPLNSNITYRQKEILERIRKNRLNEGGSQSEIPDFFELWNI